MKRLGHLFLLLAIGLLALTFSRPALAHGHLEVGEYKLVIGFRNEPAYQGEPNGLDLVVTRLATDEPVNGLADTLQVAIIRGSAERTLEIRPQYGREGAYTAYVLPSDAGDYTWHIWGTIDGTPVDVQMTSSPETFSPVRAKSEVSFPASEPATTDLTAQLTAANNTARMALAVGAVGLVTGIGGIVVGLRGAQRVSGNSGRVVRAGS